MKCFPIEFFKNFNGFEKINKIQIWSKRSKLTIYAYKGVICRVKVQKEDFFRTILGEKLVKRTARCGKRVMITQKKKILLVSQFKKLSFKSSPVKKFESQGQKTPKFWTSAVVHYHLLKAWKSQLWATRAFFSIQIVSVLVHKHICPY